MKSFCLIAATCGLALMQGCGKESGKTENADTEDPKLNDDGTKVNGMRRTTGMKNGGMKNGGMQNGVLQTEPQSTFRKMVRICNDFVGDLDKVHDAQTYKRKVRLYYDNLATQIGLRVFFPEFKRAAEQVDEKMAATEQRLTLTSADKLEVVEIRQIFLQGCAKESGKTEKVSPSSTDVSTEPQSTFRKMVRICNDFVHDLDSVHDAQTYKQKLRLYYDNLATQIEIGMRGDNTDGVPEFKRAGAQVVEKLAATQQKFHWTPEDAREVDQIEQKFNERIARAKD